MSCPSLDLQTNKLPKLNPHSLQAPRQTTNPYLRPIAIPVLVGLSVALLKKQEA